MHYEDKKTGFKFDAVSGLPKENTAEAFEELFAANKAEVEQVSASAVIWDAITRLERTDSTQDERLAAADGLRALATPPATTGASTVLTDERDCDSAFDHWYAAQSHQLTNEQLCRLIWDRGWQASVAAQAGQVAVPDDQLEWSHDLQKRLIAAGEDFDEDEYAGQLIAEAACLLAALTGVPAPTPGESQEGGAA